MTLPFAITTMLVLLNRVFIPVALETVTTPEVHMQRRRTIVKQRRRRAARHLSMFARAHQGFMALVRHEQAHLATTESLSLTCLACDRLSDCKQLRLRPRAMTRTSESHCCLRFRCTFFAAWAASRMLRSSVWLLL